jgi:TPP-dependent pyruvate/acetoin dehydrogenase alpha subunit
MNGEIRDEMEDAFTFADESPDPTPEDLYSDVHVE